MTMPGTRPAAAEPEGPAVSLNSRSRTPLALTCGVMLGVFAALASGAPARALSILDEYAARFPHAAMAPEATVLRIEALERARNGERLAR